MTTCTSIRNSSKREFIAITNMRPALKKALRRVGASMNPPCSCGRVVHELLEKEYGAIADEIQQQEFHAAESGAEK